MAYLGNRPATGENNAFRILDDISSHVVSFNGSSASVVSVSADTITIAGSEHRYITGQRVTYSKGGGTVITGLTDATAYYVIKDSDTTIQLATTASNATNGVAVNLTGLGAGTAHTLTLAFDGTNTKFKPTYNDGSQNPIITRAAQLVLSLNGIIQQPIDSASPSAGFGIDVSGNIIFSTAPDANDDFWGHVHASNTVTFDISDNDIDNFTGDGSTANFNLSKTPPDNRNILVTLDGVVQYPSDNSNTRAYTLSENELQMVSAPGNGVAIQVRHIGFAGPTAGGGGGVTGFYGRTGNVVLKSTDNPVIGNLTAVDGTFSGNVSIAKTLTYMDVAHIDAVGVITAQSDVNFNGSGAGISSSYWDSSANEFKFKDNVTLSFGDGQDLKLLHNGTNSVINNTTGSLLFQNGGSSSAWINSSGVIYTNNDILFQGASSNVVWDKSENYFTFPDKIAVHTGDADTAIRFPADDTISFETGATSKVFINSAGDLTLGATAGNLGKLYIKQGADTDTEGVALLNSGGTNSFKIFLGDSSGAIAHFGHGGQKQLNITQAGKVGIGTSNPDELLHLASTGTAKFRLTDERTSISDTSQYGVIQFEQRDSNTPGVSAEVAAVMQDTSNGNTALQFKTGTPSTIAERLRITGHGNMALGNDGSFPIYTDTNDRNFIIGTGSDDTAIQIHSGSDKYGGVYFGDATSGGDRYRGYVEFKHGTSDDYLRFAAGGGEKLRITKDGQLVSTGTAAELSLTNSGSTATEQTGYFYTSGSGIHNRVLIKTSTNNGGDPYIKFDAGGQDMIVGSRYVGTTNNLLVMGPGLDPDTSTAIFVKGTGFVGINTTNMSSTLQIYGANDGEGTATGQITLKDTAAYDATPTGGIVFQGHHTAGAQAIFAGIRGFKANGSNGDYDGCLGFDVRKHGAVAYEAIRIDEDGNLHVKGTNHEVRFYRDDGARYGAITYDGGNFNIKNPANDHTRVLNHGGTELISFNHDTTIDIPGGVINLGTADTSSGHVNALENLTFNIDTDDDDSNTRHFRWFKNGYSGSGTELMRLGEDGKVGIATVTAATTLDVHGDVAVAYNATHALRFYTQPRNNWSSISNTATDSNANLSIKVSQGEAIRILYNKKVGIGTDNPATKLEVNGQISQTEINTNVTTSSSSAVKRVFIYDTRMDSDGGAWRNSERVKATSWYTESLGTSTRGSRAEFPVVAILVLESYKLTIFDGDDPAMPMWMVFDRKNDNASTGWWDGNNSNYGTDVHCLNGYMYLTTSAAGGYSLNWISEEMRNWYVTTYSGARTGATIADRNSNTFPIRNGSDPQGGMTVSASQRSVDMRVMDNAEIDHQTGLPQPHVLIGSSGDNANMIRIIDDNFKTSLGRAGSWTSSTGGCWEARWDHVHGGYWSSHGYHPETSGSYPNHGGSITYTPNIGISGTIQMMNANTRDTYLVGQGKGRDNTPPQLTGVYQHEGSHWTSSSVANFWLPNPSHSNPGKWHIANNGKYFGTQHGLTVASHHLEEIPQYDNTKAERDAPVRRSLHAYIGKDYATGYLFGNDKGCYGHQTSTTSLTSAVSASLASDPTFENGHGFGSIQSSATVTHNDSANTVTITSSGASNVYAGREVTGLTAGAKYLFSLDFKRAAGSGTTGLTLHHSWANQSGTQYAGSNNLPADNTWRNMSCEFEAVGTSVWLNAYAKGTIEIDNFFIVPAANYESSRAYPARGAMAYGTVTRVPVATGAELTMLSGTDNTSDFLLERNIDIDFSKDWYLMFWCPKGEGKASIERYNSAANYNNTVCLLSMSNNEIAIRHAGSPFNSFDTPYRFVCATHRGTTNTTNLWSGPGQLLQSHTGGNWSNTYMADLNIGRGSYNNAYSHTSNASATGVALLRYGQGLPQREHLEKIYYDELALMQPNAKCTLYGSSNAIKGMAWDKSTDLVHVGTSSGRSDFLGLRRINNTTVDTGMLDAKNGLIAEDI